MISRRSLLQAGATGALALSAGCLGFVTGEDALEFDAAKVLPTDDALAETGYEETEAKWERFEETISVGVERDVAASIWIAMYEKRVAIPVDELEGTGANVEGVGDLDVTIEGEAATFAAISMPAMDVLGSTQNPLADMDTREVLEEFRGELETSYGRIRDIRHDETVELDILDDRRDVERFVATVEIEGQEVELDLHVAVFAHEGDLLILLGGYPRVLPDEGTNVETLMESVEHPLEE